MHEGKEGIEVQQDYKQYEGRQQGNVVICYNQNDLIKCCNLFDQVQKKDGICDLHIGQVGTYGYQNIKSISQMERVVEN